MSERPDENAKEPSHRLRFGVGLLLGTLLVAGVGHRLLSTSLGETARFGEDRRAVVSLRALTDLVARAVELGQPALGLTDRDGLYGAVRFVRACTEAGIEPVLGVDLALG